MKAFLCVCLCIIGMYAKNLSSTPALLPTKILVSVLPQKEMIEYIGGKYVEVEVLVPRGKSPEIYEPNIAQMRHIEDSRVFFGVGMPFESAWLKRIKHINPSLVYYNLTDEIFLQSNSSIQPQPKQQEHDHNPHIWLSPKASLAQIAFITQKLSEIHKEQSSFFAQNAALLKTKIEAIQKHTARIFALEKSQKNFVTYHPALTYWGAEFHLKELSLEHNGKELKGRELSTLMAEIKNQKIQAIFIQPEFAKSRVEMLARELGLKIIELDVLRQDWLLSLQDIACQIAFSLSQPESTKCVQEYFKDK